jgi:hypothetical protein
MSNGDIVENPDPEADSEILDFTNATEDEFHLNNNAEDEFQLNITAAESSHQLLLQLVPLHHSFFL